MTIVQAGLALSLAVLLGACATEWRRSYDRWYGYTAEQGPYTRWALCIEQRSAHHIDPAGMGPVTFSHDGSRGRAFAQVLADCREFMSGPGWDGLRSDQLGRLIRDALQAFDIEEAEALARASAAISTESQN
jgi:hypothetical protein